MSRKVASPLSIAFTTFLLLYKLRQHAPSLWFDSNSERLYYCIRKLLWKRSTYRSLADWQDQNCWDVEPRMAVWMFLAPYFKSRGYSLYRSRPGKSPGAVYLEAVSGERPDESYPYARRLYKDDDGAVFYPAAPATVWPARDRVGHDVIIKVVSDSRSSVELDVLQRLNSDKLRADPRNHTIPLLDVIKFDKWTFIVMPRWDCAFGPDFSTISELLHFALVFLEAFDFLHENRVAHCDFLEQNSGMNIVDDYRVPHARGVRKPSEAQYALFDFGYSAIFPYDTDISKVKQDRHLGFIFRGLDAGDGPWNPFEFDVLCAGWVLQRWVRHIEDIVPELGPFFDSINDPDPTTRLTAHQAVAAFRRIYSNLTPSQMQRKLTTLWWENGEVITTNKIRGERND